MKLWSKEALLLGGIYGVLGTPFTYAENDLFELIVVTISLYLDNDSSPIFTL